MAVVEEVEVEEPDCVEVTEEVDTDKAASADEDSKDSKAAVSSQAPAASEVPAAPAGPEFKLSSIVPMVAMMGLQKYNLEEMGLTHHVEIAYVIVQVLCLGVLYLVYSRINQMEDDGIRLKIPEVKQMGQVVSPAKEQTTKEYDLEKLKEAAKQPIMSFVILGGIYYKWGSLMPLVMQVLMTPMQLYEAPLTQIHVLGKKVARPFPVANMFGMPSAPAPEVEPAVADTPEDKKAVADKKEAKKAK